MTSKTIKKILIIVNDVFAIKPHKDSSFAIMLAAQARAYQVFCCRSKDLFAKGALVYTKASQLSLVDRADHFVSIIKTGVVNLKTFDIIFMRQDPPFNMAYIYTTYLLEQAEKQGVFIVNKPQSLRDFNEKLAILKLPHCIPETLVSSQMTILIDFLLIQKTIVIKPLDNMGGINIFKLSAEKLSDAKNKIKYLTKQQTLPIMAQQFLTQIKAGDKRILFIDAEPISYGLNRIPPPHHWKGNLAQGAVGIAEPLNKRDKWLCEQITPILKNKGLFFVGIDVIGPYITEINITSPTGIRELDKQCGLNIADELLTAIIKKLN